MSMLARAEVHEIRHLFQDNGSAFQASSFAGGKVNFRRDPGSSSFQNVVILSVRQMG